MIRMPSYLDLKMGTDCVKLDPDDSNYQEFIDLDLTTTTKEYGYRLTGVCVYEMNRVVEYMCENFDFTKTYE